MTRLSYKNIIAAIAYADVFDYPLKRSELSLWGVFGVDHIPLSIPGIMRVGEYVVLSNRKHIVNIRKERKRIAAVKWKHIQKIVKIFRYVPTVLLVGVTGGLAVDNASEQDDIDLFFITKKGTLWITRMLVTIFADCFAIRRHPQDKQVTNKICLNMFMSEDALELPKNEQDLFAAHEVVQMVPLWQRCGEYKKFLQANRWTKFFLPNIWKKRIQNTSKTVNHTKDYFVFPIIYYLLFLFEPIAQILQLWYMKKKRTNEIIRSGMIRFHPHDARIWVREKYAGRLKKWDIPLDNIFYHP